jgi:hypothetical protein
MEEFKLCSWAWTKNRHKKISSMARSRYALESLFNDVRNDNFSKSEAEGGGSTGFVVEGPIRLGNDKLSSE